MVQVVLTAASESEAEFVAGLMGWYLHMRADGGAERVGQVSLHGRDIVVVASVADADRIGEAMASAGCRVEVVAMAEA